MQDVDHVGDPFAGQTAAGRGGTRSILEPLAIMDHVRGGGKNVRC